MPRFAVRRQSVTFELLPSIDLRRGRVVRLQEGDFARQTTYSDDPVAVARMFERQGASWIHVVDLDGARGETRQVDALRAILAGGSSARYQVAGGLRSTTSIVEILEAGAARVVVGTAALADPSWVGELVASVGADRVVAALDVRDGVAIGDGWRQGAPGRPVKDALGVLADAGVERYAVTAIARDGLMAGPDLALLESLVREDRGEIIASGGISSIADLVAVRSIGCSGAIIGRAVYEGTVDLAEAVAAISETPDR